MWDKYSAYKSEDWVVAVATTIDDNEVDGNLDKWNSLVFNVNCISVIGLHMSTLLPEFGHFRTEPKKCAKNPSQDQRNTIINHVRAAADNFFL